MDTLQIEEALKDLFQEKHVFYGVFARDELPKTIPFLPAAIVFNMDVASAPGSHWLGIVIKKLPHHPYPTVYFVDSFGKNPSFYDIQLYLASFSHDIRYFNDQLQSSETATCGAFAIYCLFYLLYQRVGTLTDVSVHLLKNNMLSNDVMVYNFVHAKFPYFRFPFHAYNNFLT